MPIRNEAKRKAADVSRSKARRARAAEARGTLPSVDKWKFARWFKRVRADENKKLSDFEGFDDSYLRRMELEVFEPRAAQTFAIGEAMHESGIAWSSGPVALFDSNHLPEFIDFLAALTTIDGQRVTATFIVALEEYATAHRRLPGDLSRAREKLATCYNAVGFREAWKLATDPNRAAKNQRSAATELQVARIWASALDISADDRQQRIIEALVVWLTRREPAFISDYLYLRWCQSRAAAEVRWAGPDRVETFREVLRGAAMMYRSNVRGTTGRGKNVG
jgi:hypothetical protein